MYYAIYFLISLLITIRISLEYITVCNYMIMIINKYIVISVS